MKYPLRVVSVERSLFEGDVEFMIANGAEGELGVLPDRVTVLADVAEHAEDISIEAAEEARRRAQERLAGTLSADEEIEFQNALAMAEARLRLARARRG